MFHIHPLSRCSVLFHQTVKQLAIITCVLATTLSAAETSTPMDIDAFKARILPADSDGIFAPFHETHSTWGADIVKDEKTGVYHIFAAHWEGGLYQWRKNSRIIRGEGPTPWGPWEYKEQLDALLEGSDLMVHNPDVAYRPADGKYYLYYSRHTKETGTISMAVADQPAGPWVPSPHNPVLTTEKLLFPDSISQKKQKGLKWSPEATNPAVMFDGEKVYLVYRNGGNHLTVATDPAGPFTYVRGGVAHFEDPTIWREQGVTYVASHGGFGASPDMKQFSKFEEDPFEPPVYVAGVEPPYPGVSRQERPKVFVENGVAVAFSSAISPKVKRGGKTFNVTQRLKPLHSVSDNPNEENASACDE